MFAHVTCFGFNDNMLHQSLCWYLVTVINTCEQNCYTIQLPTQSHDLVQQVCAGPLPKVSLQVGDV